MDMPEKPFYLENNGHRLYCIQYMPAGRAKCGVVLCHPFAEEKLWSQRVFVSFARLLAQHGYCVLRVDYRGHGDSEGDFADATVKTRLADIDGALDYLKAELGAHTPLCVAGLRLGATLAAMVADSRSDVNHLALWEPIVDGKAYMQQLFRINIATQSAVYKQVLNNSDALAEKLKNKGTVNIDGYEIGCDFYEQLIGINLLDRKSTFAGEVVLISIARNLAKVNRALLKLKQQYAHISFSTVVEEPFWTNTQAYCKRAHHLSGVTLQWLEGKCA